MYHKGPFCTSMYEWVLPMTLGENRTSWIEKKYALRLNVWKSPNADKLWRSVILLRLQETKEDSESVRHVRGHQAMVAPTKGSATQTPPEVVVGALSHQRHQNCKCCWGTGVTLRDSLCTCLEATVTPAQPFPWANSWAWGLGASVWRVYPGGGNTGRE